MSEVKFGKRLLETLTSALYSDPIVVFREYVQNSVDSFIRNRQKKQQDFLVSITIDLNNKRIVIRDNGYGIAQEIFESVMIKISDSNKTSDEIGFRGIGRLSGMSFCDRLIFKNKNEQSDILQIFEWKNKAYKEILKTDTEESLAAVIERITENRTESKHNDEHYFEVEMIDIDNSLIDYMAVESENSLVLKEEFKTALKNLLPVPYSDNFSYKNQIYEEYNKAFSETLKQYEFNITLNNEPIIKTYCDNDIKDNNIHFIPFKLKLPESGDEKTIGLLWLSFDYKFKAYKDENYGISVRNKNVLLSGNTIFADEASKSLMVKTTHAQYVSGIKGIKGELLIKTELLSDNSKRDWFKVDDYSLQLREMICQFMNHMHEYRYKASAFFNARKNNESKKEELLKAFEDFVTGLDIDKAAEMYTSWQMRKEKNALNAHTPNPIADTTDLPSYNNTQKQFYEKIMNTIYEYFDQRDEINNYYALKAFVAKKLNN